MTVVKNLLVLIRRLRKGGGAVLRRVEILVEERGVDEIDAAVVEQGDILLSTVGFSESLLHVGNASAMARGGRNVRL